MNDREYNPSEDERYGQRNYGPIDWSAQPWLAVYMAKLAKGWPANMAAVAARKSTVKAEVAAVMQYEIMGGGRSSDPGSVE